MHQHIQELFSLQGLLVGTVALIEGTVAVSARSARQSMCCPRCGISTRRVHQRRTRTVTHGVFEGKPIRLTILYRRFLCRLCGRPFTEPLPGLDRKRTSTHGRQQIVHRLATQSFHRTADEFSLGTMTVKRALLAAHHERTIAWKTQGSPIHLGIDEHSFRGHDMALTVTNLSQKKVLTILPDDRQETLRRFLRAIPHEARGRITEVCIDMRAGFRTAIHEVLPDTKIVVDHFHVIAAANETIDHIRQVVFSGRDWHPKVRRLLFQNREDLTTEELGKLMQVFEHYRKFPSLEIAWQVKEKLRAMYRATDRNNAEHQYRLILAYLTGIESRSLMDLRGMLTRWQPCILNFFDHRTTNAFTEGCHTKIKLTKRVSYGFRNRTVYIAKMLLAFAPFFAVIHHTY